MPPRHFECSVVRQIFFVKHSVVERGKNVRCCNIPRHNDFSTQSIRFSAIVLPPMEITQVSRIASKCTQHIQIIIFSNLLLAQIASAIHIDRLRFSRESLEHFSCPQMTITSRNATHCARVSGLASAGCAKRKQLIGPIGLTDRADRTDRADQADRVEEFGHPASSDTAGLPKQSPPSVLGPMIPNTKTMASLESSRKSFGPDHWICNPSLQDTRSAYNDPSRFKHMSGTNKNTQCKKRFVKEPNAIERLLHYCHV